MQPIERPELSDAEVFWLAAWNIANGDWTSVRMSEDEGREFLLQLFNQLTGNVPAIVHRARGTLQHALMAQRNGTFEQIQRESPFSCQAQENMSALLEGRERDQDSGFLRAWNERFPAGVRTQAKEEPILFPAQAGDCEEHALNLQGAADRDTRAAAEWWYLFYEFGRSWESEQHATLRSKDGSTHFSVHSIRIFPDTQRRVFFQFPW